MTIRILGSGCRNCHTLEQRVQEAVAQLGLTDVRVEMVTDFLEFARYGILATPGLVIDDVVVSSGRVNTVDEIIGYLRARV